jgi:hypothetical protein
MIAEGAARLAAPSAFSFPRAWQAKYSRPEMRLVPPGDYLLSIKDTHLVQTTDSAFGKMRRETLSRGSLAVPTFGSGVLESRPQPP